MPRLWLNWRPGVPWVCAALAVAAPPVTRAADPQPYDVSLAPTGHESLDTALRDSTTLISLRESAPVGPFALVQRARQDLARWQSVLQGSGFYQPRISVTIDGQSLDDPMLPQHLDSVAAGRKVPIAVNVAPGPMFRIGHVSVDGSISPTARNALQLSEGADAVAADILAARDRLLAALRAAGHPLANVTIPPATLHPDTHRLDVTFIAEAGPPAPIGDIRVTGLDMVRDGFVRERLLLRSGQGFSPAAIEEARADLMTLGVFSSVRIEPAEALASDGSLPVLVDVAERKRHALELGASYATDLGIGLTAAWRHRNLFGNAEQLSFSGAFHFGGSAATGPSYEATARFVKPDFGARDQSLDLKLTAVQQSLKAYDHTAVIGTAALSRKLGPHWTVSLGILAEVERITQESRTDTYHLLGVPLTARSDSTNSVFDPTAGIRAAFSVTPTQSLGQNGGTFVISQASASAYLDLAGDRRSLLAVRGLVGQASGVDVFGLPPDHRFCAGGSGTVRGFRYQSIGPRFPGGNPTGGTAVAAGTIEIRQRVYGDFGMVAFVDAGQVTDDSVPFSGD
jgi:translocation and assembly module TamA